MTNKTLTEAVKACALIDTANRLLGMNSLLIAYDVIIECIVTEFNLLNGIDDEFESDEVHRAVIATLEHFNNALSVTIEDFLEVYNTFKSGNVPF